MTIAVTIVVNISTTKKNGLPDDEDSPYSKEDDNVWADIDIDEGGDDIAPPNTMILDAVENFHKTNTVDMGKSPSDVEELPKFLPSPDITVQKRACMHDEPGHGDVDSDTPQKVIEQENHPEFESGGDEGYETPQKEEEHGDQSTTVPVNDPYSRRNMFSGSEKAPRLGTMEEYTHRMNEHQNILSVHEENNTKDNTAPEISVVHTLMQSGDVDLVPVIPTIVEDVILRGTWIRENCFVHSPT